MNNFISKFEKSSKFNIFIGEYANKLSNVPMQSDIAYKLWNDMGENSPKDINRYSLPEVTQQYLDNILADKYNLIDNLKEIFLSKENIDIKFQRALIESNIFKNIFTLNYDTIIEDFYPENIHKFTPFNYKKVGENLINLFKIFGDVDIITTQDIKKLLLIPRFTEFWKELRDEIKKYPTILFGVNFRNEDTINILKFILDPIIYEYKTLYIASSSVYVNTSMLEFINKYNLKIVSLDDEEFLNLIKNTSSEDLKNFEEMSQTEENEEKDNKIINIYSYGEINLGDNPEKIELNDIAPDEFEEKTVSIAQTLPLYENETEKDDEPQIKDKIIEIGENEDVIQTKKESLYKNFHLTSFPIIYQNFSHDNLTNEEMSIGRCDISVGNYILKDSRLKLKMYENFTLLEIKRNDFSISFEVRPNGTLILNTGSLFQYEINSNVRDIRLKNIVELFIEIFSGTPIKCNINKFIIDISFDNATEESKFKLLLDTLDSYENINSQLKVSSPRNLLEINNSCYEIFLLDKFLSDETMETFVNIDMANDYKIKSGDMLTFKRRHNINIKGANFIIVEHIILDEPVDSENINDNKVIFINRKARIELEKIQTKKKERW